MPRVVLAVAAASMLGRARIRGCSAQIWRVVGAARAVGGVGLATGVVRLGRCWPVRVSVHAGRGQVWSCCSRLFRREAACLVGPTACSVKVCGVLQTAWCWLELLVFLVQWPLRGVGGPAGCMSGGATLSQICSFPNMCRLRAKDKIKMAIKHGFNDKDEEEVTQMSDTMNLKEATLADKITKEALSKVMAHRKASALTAPGGPRQLPPCPREHHRPDPYPRDCPDLHSGPSHPLNV
ncbi:hypothetical protein ZWY2020_007541 [Hordeum vulgare]|nr:hypothetical protein ZWY2020_007541 [Hordeum vulgare]